MKVNKPNMAQKGSITVEKTGGVFSGVNVSGSEDSDVIYQPVYEVAGLEGAVYEVRAAEDISTPDGTLPVSYTHLCLARGVENKYCYDRLGNESVRYIAIMRWL